MKIALLIVLVSVIFTYFLGSVGGGEDRKTYILATTVLLGLLVAVSKYL